MPFHIAAFDGPGFRPKRQVGKCSASHRPMFRFKRGSYRMGLPQGAAGEPIGTRGGRCTCARWTIVFVGSIGSFG